MPLVDYVLTIALGGAFALGLMFIVMRREAQVNLQSGMSAEGLLQQHSGMGFGKAKKIWIANLQPFRTSCANKIRATVNWPRNASTNAAGNRPTPGGGSTTTGNLTKRDANGELDAERQRQDEEAARRAAERDAEEARLAAEQEAQRQQELADAEDARQAEIEVAASKRCLNPVMPPSVPCLNFSTFGARGGAIIRRSKFR